MSDHWLNEFKVGIYDGKKPNLKGKIVLTTPMIEYFFTKEQWRQFKEKVNSL